MSEQQQDPLSKPVQYVKGVGPARAERLRRLGIETVEQLLLHLPRDYEDLSEVRAIAAIEPGQRVTVQGEIADLDVRQTRRGTIAAALLSDGTGHLRIVWFNQPHMVERFRIGQKVLVTGKATWYDGYFQMAHPDVRPLTDGMAQLPFLPIYPLTEQLSIHELRRIMREAVDRYAEFVPERLPESIRQRRGLPPVHEAIAQVHFPPNREAAERARRRLAYEEFLLLQLALAVRHRSFRFDRRAPKLEVTERIDERIRRLLPFKLTEDQERAIAEICADLRSGRPMNRLLQGDVGSGKTAVAVYAILVAIANRYQAAIMAPTEVLAQQHWRTFESYLAHSRVRRLLLTGALKPSERQEALRKIAAGEIDLVVGTQAIIQQDVQFDRLGLVVIDEQHKFGVRQRARFKQKGEDPHYLVMTATPIPRTLTMTVFGDLDVSIIRQMPPGRKPVRTYLIERDREEQMWEFVRRKLDEGRQAYVICPLVEESEKMDVAAAENVFHQLQAGQFAGVPIGLVHGRMNDAEKEAAMSQFREGRTRLLVSTPVVEVGVDVPNATIMVIIDAQRFGLSQLHQLRGRVARGTVPGYCFLLAQPTDELAKERLRVIVKTTDGFEIAEEDLRLRGPGELLGTRQHGLPELRIGSLIADADLITQARQDAFEIIRRDPRLELPEHRPLREAMINRFGLALQLADVG